MSVILCLIFAHIQLYMFSHCEITVLKTLYNSYDISFYYKEYSKQNIKGCKLLS